MCGIAGAFAYRAEAPPIDKAELLRVRDAMVARGPDAAGLWMAADGRVAGLPNAALTAGCQSRRATARANEASGSAGNRREGIDGIRR